MTPPAKCVAAFDHPTARRTLLGPYGRAACMRRMADSILRESDCAARHGCYYRRLNGDQLEFVARGDEASQRI